MQLGVDFYPHFEGGVIIVCDSVVTYKIQSGGYACNHYSVKGAYIPLFGSPVMDRLEEFFCGDKWGGWCCDGIDEETALFVERTLSDHEITGIKVDRNKMKESEEAWIWCHYIDNPGVLVWGNSD